MITLSTNDNGFNIYRKISNCLNADIQKMGLKCMKTNKLIEYNSKSAVENYNLLENTNIQLIITLEKVNDLPPVNLTMNI